MKIYDRHEKRYIETQQYGQEKLKFLYETPIGRILLKLAVSPVTSKVYGFYNSLPASKKKIPDFISEYDIRMEDYEKCEYASFNDFFTRRFTADARKIARSPDRFISPADSKLLVYDITEDLKMNIKGSEYTLDELVGGRVDVKDLHGGVCMVFRLCMDDCHRYCFIDSGSVKDSYFIRGKLHTVSSISKAYKIYKENSRAISVCETDHFGRVIQIEVGALLVGGIRNKNAKVFKKGDEKGYFEPGGSTIVLLAEKNKIIIDSDIIEQSRSGIETVVRFGEGIGRRAYA